ncbi:hypothetical protein AOLI_G00322960 [Acnodon oligacanthus]
MGVYMRSVKITLHRNSQMVPPEVRQSLPSAPGEENMTPPPAFCTALNHHVQSERKATSGRSGAEYKEAIKSKLFKQNPNRTVGAWDGRGRRRRPGEQGSWRRKRDSKLCMAHGMTQASGV